MMRPVALFACLCTATLLSLAACDSGKQPPATPPTTPTTPKVTPTDPGTAPTTSDPSTTPATTTTTPKTSDGNTTTPKTTTDPATPTTPTPITDPATTAVTSVPGRKPDGTTAGQVLDFATKVKPLDVGMALPNVTLKDTQGKDVELAKLIADKPTVLVFYRGGWCIFCKRQLAGLAEAHPKLTQMGYQLIAISMDTPDRAASLAVDTGLAFTLLSDSKADAVKAFGLAYKLDDESVKRYATFNNINIEAASGEKHHILPVPAVYLLGADGSIKFRHYDPDYSKRLDAMKLIDEAQVALYRK